MKTVKDLIFSPWGGIVLAFGVFCLALNLIGCATMRTPRQYVQEGKTEKDLSHDRYDCDSIARTAAGNGSLRMVGFMGYGNSFQAEVDRCMKEKYGWAVKQ